MDLGDQVFVMLLVPILALVPQLTVAALKRLEEHRKLEHNGEDRDNCYFGL